MRGLPSLARSDWCLSGPNYCGFGCRTVRKCVVLPRFSGSCRHWVPQAHSQAEGPRLRGLSAVARIDRCLSGPKY